MEVFNAILLAVNFPISAQKLLSHDYLACLDFNTVIVCFYLSLFSRGMFHLELRMTGMFTRLSRMLKRFSRCKLHNLSCVRVERTQQCTRQPAAFAMCRNDKTWTVVLRAAHTIKIPNVPRRELCSGASNSFIRALRQLQTRNRPKALQKINLTMMRVSKLPV